MKSRLGFIFAANNDPKIIYIESPQFHSRICQDLPPTSAGRAPGWLKMLKMKKTVVGKISVLVHLSLAPEIKLGKNVKKGKFEVCR